MTGPYGDFLATADAGRWLASARELARAPEVTAEAVCVAAYTWWLGRVSGATEIEQEAQRIYKGLRPGATDRAWGVFLAFDGYRRRGAEILERDGPLPPEHALVVLPRSPVRAAAMLRATDPGRPPFLPLTHFHAMALADLGAVDEARELVLSRDPGAAHPLSIDLLGTVAERLGQWPRAEELYRRSPWPAHAYRAEMVAAIGGGPAPKPGAVLDEAALRWAGELGGELDETELARFLALVDAFQWQPVRNWVVEVELGKLDFRRRRYAEADTHLRRALDTAPERARFLISRLRFYAFTWLTGGDPHIVLRMTPEAVTAGRAALDQAGPDDDTTDIRVWIASETGDLALIPAGLSGWEPYPRGNALSAVGEIPSALDAWIEALRGEYVPRAVFQLMRHLRRQGLPRAAVRLAAIAARESDDEFGPLFELAEALQDIGAPAGADGPDGPETELARVAEAVRARVLELSELGFRNAVLAYGLLRRDDQLDEAEQLLQRLAKQAEGVSELVAVAVVRRGSPMTALSHEEGLRCLTRASAEARDTSERLQIARELFHYGQLGQARALLRDERALEDGRRLSHAEAAVVLQCGAWLGAAEGEEFADRAVDRLLTDAASGALGPDAAIYGNRMAQGATGPLHDRVRSRLGGLAGVPGGSAWPGEASALWGDLGARIERETDEPAGLDDLSGPGSTVGLRLAALGRLREQLTSWVDAGRQAPVEIEPEEFPVRDGADRGDGLRPIQLRDLWRARLTPSAGEAEARRADGALRSFLAEERALAERCARLRHEAAAPSFRRAVNAGEALLALLPGVLGPAERAEPHPVLREVFAALADDLEATGAEVREQLAALGEAPGER
ncbi:hypothetical protein ACFY36_30525 [Actinoplanes sp. NPDC000266]